MISVDSDSSVCPASVTSASISSLVDLISSGTRTTQPVIHDEHQLELRTLSVADEPGRQCRVSTSRPSALMIASQNGTNIGAATYYGVVAAAILFVRDAAAPI